MNTQLVPCRFLLRLPERDPFPTFSASAVALYILSSWTIKLHTGVKRMGFFVFSTFNLCRSSWETLNFSFTDDRNFIVRFFPLRILTNLIFFLWNLMKDLKFFNKVRSQIFFPQSFFFSEFLETFSWNSEENVRNWSLKAGFWRDFSSGFWETSFLSSSIWEKSHNSAAD